MKKLNKIMLALSILPTLLTSVFLFFMNDTVPMHYNASGAVDRYGSKYENFILPAIILFMYAFYMVYTKIYTKYSTNSVEKINNNVKITAILVTSIIAAFNILQLMFLILAILKPDSTTFTDNVLSLFAQIKKTFRTKWKNLKIRFLHIVAKIFPKNKNTLQRFYSSARCFLC